jgi:hypothetical protein
MEQAALHGDRVAVVIETRAHAALPLVVRTLHAVAPRWPILFLHGTGIADWAAEQEDLRALREAGVLQLEPLAVSRLDRGAYSRMLLSPVFYERLRYRHCAEWALIFQADTLLCRGARDSLDDFVDVRRWDYVGAPWADGGVGNGGLSLRHCAAHAAALRAVGERDGLGALAAKAGTENEDKIIAAIPEIRKAPPDVAARFALEAPGPGDCWWRAADGAPVGVHKPWLHMTESMLAALSTVCLELPALRERSVGERGAWALVRVPGPAGAVTLRVPPTLAVRSATREQLLAQGERVQE